MSKIIPPLHDVDIRLLRLFMVVVESEGFAAAEEALGVGRSTISKHMADLEARLGIRLCDRGRGGFKITAHGRVVYDATLELLDSLDTFRARVSTAKGRIFGVVNLWVMDNTLFEVDNPVGQALRHFEARDGQVELKINAASPMAVEEAVATRRANVGLTIVNTDISGLHYQHVGVETAALYCGVDHELAHRRPGGDIGDSDLDDADFVSRGYLRSQPTLRGRQRKSSAVAYHVEGAVQLILSGHFVGVLPDHIAKPWVDMGKMVQLDLPEALSSTPLYIVTRQRTGHIPVIAALVEDLATAYARK